MNKQIRVASLQYFIRPVASFDQFHDQVASLVETASDYKCQLVVFPEYFTTQLLTLNNVKRPIREQVRSLALQSPRFVEMIGVVRGNLKDPTLSFQMKHGFTVIDVVADYLHHDENASHGYAAIIEWLNPHFPNFEGLENRDRRFLREE